MHEQVAAVNANGRDDRDFSAAEPHHSGSRDRAERPTAKFTYPGGSRPLEGYTIKRGIGHGGFGEIYYALSDAGKEVALKLIRRNLDIELRGIRHCLNLKHPNLLSLYDIRQDDKGDTWVVMEYVSGGCLADALAASPDGMPPEQALTWFRGTAAGVAHLHDRGIVHRDLKPGNIFCEEGLVKVGDYGLSKFISCSRRSGQTESVGTVHYMAPEVANGRYGKEIDVYALGVILYEMLTGRVPFEGESVGEVLMKHLTAKPDVSMLPEPYLSVVARALEKDPAKRFSSVSDMLAALPGAGEAPVGSDRLPSGTYGAAAAGARRLPETRAIPKAEVVDEEPILKAVREGCTKMQASWDEANLPTWAKVLILVAALVFVAFNPWFVGLALALLVIYGVYRLVRAAVLSGQSRARPVAEKPSVWPRDRIRAAISGQPRERPMPQSPPSRPAPPRPVTADARVRPVHRRKLGRREEAMAALVIKPPRERLTELVGSLLGGALVAVVMCVVMVLLNTLVYDAGETVAYALYAQYAWLVMVSIAGTWAVMIPAKFWEGTRGEAVLRRFITMVTGLGLGVLAFGIASMLMVHAPSYSFIGDFLEWTPVERSGLPHFYGAGPDGQPLLMAYVAVFGTLFLLTRWWRQANPLRPARLSLWWVFVSMAVAALVAWLWAFPESWAAIVAGAMSASIQLASPWVHPRERSRRKKV